jgi:metal-responsive CopG/Arc/MetJ family transcriptional regulator
MRAAVSIPDDIFQQAEQLARRTRKSRSQLLSDAVREYVSRHSPTEAMDRALAEFVTEASRRILERTEW